MAIPVSASINQLNAEVFIQEGYELSLDAIVPSIELTGSFSQTTSKTQFYIYNYAKTLLYENLNYNANGSFLLPKSGTTISNSSSSYNQFELNPIEDIYNQGYSSGNYYALYNFVDYELGSEFDKIDNSEDYNGHPYFIKDISGDRTELRIQNNFLSTTQIESYYQQFINKINARENADEFYVSFENNRNFIGVNSQLELPSSGSNTAASILIKLYKSLPLEFEVEQQLQIISKVGETQVFSIDFQPNLEFVDNLLQLKGPNYNIDIKDRINNSTNFKNLNDLINTNSSQSYYQFNSLKNQKGIILRKNWGDWNEFVKYSSAEQRLRNFKDKLTSIESYEAELRSLETIGGGTPGSPTYSSSYNNVTNNINKIVSKFDSYEYYLYYVTGSEAWPKRTTTYPYVNYSVTSSEALNWFGSTNENNVYYNSGKNQIYSASRYDNNNQDYLYYLIPPFITENSSNDQYIKFVNMVGQTFDEIYIYTEGVEQVRNTNSGLTGSVLPLGLADEVIESLGFDTYGNDFNSIGFNPNGVGVFPAAGSGLEYITRYVDIASGSVINYYDQQQSTLGYVIALADPSFPYPIENSAQEIYKRIFHNMVSLVKRKGTITGLRQLINVWGVPSTMLRISEFGGKNKDDENDYDLWMNRYSNALTTYNYKEGALEPSGSIRAPWQPLTSNYYSDAEYAVPDCIQFRFKSDEPITPTSNFSQSLLVKGNIFQGFADFAVVLGYSGSQSGSFSGSILPTDYQYGTLQFVLDGTNVAITDPIYLPFFNGDWWSVQIQRKNHIAQSGQNNVVNHWELRTANNIYDGYDGNQIGFQASQSFTRAGDTTYNAAWNDIHGVTTFNPSGNSYVKGYSALVLGGMMHNGSANNQYVKSQGATGKFIGKGFSGSFQELRLYRRALSASQFNDYVMNPESIQGHADSTTGAGSSYDLLSFRLPLGNELEYTNISGSGNYTTFTNGVGSLVSALTFGGNSLFAGSNGFGSLHPSLVNKKGSLFTSSFILTTNVTSSQYSLVYQGNDGSYNSSISSSYLAPNTEINYMDQPAAGIRNRIKNKIQVIDGNEYGTILSPFRSIQQEFEQSGSYTEDLNSLEVGFSFQNEINDDIIATFGHGVVSDAIADPRFISESSDRYPELTRIAEDYFKKYQGVTITDPTYNGGLPTIIEKEYDYNRLIKFYETSLFKAIKNYVPARTSLSTGIIVKQHLLERNKATTVPGININTPIAKTPETGSDVYGYTDQTGFNSVISQRNLLITSSIPVGSLTGSAGGSVNKYNVITREGLFSSFEAEDVTLVDGAAPIPLFSILPNYITQIEDGIFPGIDNTGKIYYQSEVAFKSQVYLRYYFTAPPSNPHNIIVSVTSSKRGGIFQTSQAISTQNPDGVASDNLIEVYPDERLYWNVSGNGNGGNIVINITELTFGPNINSNNLSGYTAVFSEPTPLTSQQVNWYIDDFTGEYKVDDHQTEFYDGEFSGSNFEVIPPQYNPYRIFADGNDKTPDTQFPLPTPYVDFNQATLTGTGVSISAQSSQSITLTSGPGILTNFYQATGSFFNLVPDVKYVVSASIIFDPSNSSNPSSAILPISNGSLFIGIGYSTDQQLTFTFTATNLGTPGGILQPYTSGPGAGFDNGGVSVFFLGSQQPQTVQFSIHSIQAVLQELGPKHFYKNDGFTIVPSQSQLFQNSPYNPLINNVSGSRESSFYYDMDFDPVNPGSELKEGIPSDYTLLVSASQLGWNGVNPTADNLLEYAEVPDSNYTTKAIINPRYVGTTLQSADYNFYTGIPSASQLTKRSKLSGITGLANPPFLLTQNKVRYINGETGSWGGDISYGKTAVINRNPIFFAHFKSSLESKEYFGTTTFNIDQLIQVPFEEILNEQSPIITSSLINGSNENLIPMSSTFMPKRKTTIVYNQTTKTFNNVGGTILNYTQLGVGSKVNLAGGMDFIAYHSNERNLNDLSPIMYYNLPKWYDYPEASVQLSLSEETFNRSIENTPLSESIAITQSVSGFGMSYQADDEYINTPKMASNLNNIESIDGNVYFPYNQEFYNLAPQPVMAFTASLKNENGRSEGILWLKGPNPGPIPGMAFLQNISSPSSADRMAVNGPSLSIFNSFNKLMEIGDIYGSGSEYNVTAFRPTIFAGGPSTRGAGVPTPIIPSSGRILTKTASTNKSLFKGSLPILNEEEKKQRSNYFAWDVSSSLLSEYRITDDQILSIDVGDVIRISYAYPEDINNRGILTKTSQDFEVLDYNILPPNLVTSNVNLKTTTTPRFEIGSTIVDPANAGFSPMTVTSFQPLPSTGYLNFSELWKRYQAAYHNNAVFNLEGVDNDETSTFASGSITGLNTHSVVNGKGIIGVTMSLFDNNEITSDANDPTTAYNLSTNYMINFSSSFGNRTITNVSANPNNLFTSASIQPLLIKQGSQGNTNARFGNIDVGYLYDRLVVTPDPSTLVPAIPQGKIYAMTIIKREEADDRVVLNVNQPSGSRGVLTPSGDGYLIPNDLTDIQQRNVQKLINKLQSENVFQSTSPDSLK